MLKAAKVAASPDRAGVQLGFEGDGTENTNGAHGDHGCGLCGEQAAARKAVLNPTNTEDCVLTPLNLLSVHLFVCLCLPPDLFCPVPLSPPHPLEPFPSLATQKLPELMDPYLYYLEPCASFGGQTKKAVRRAFSDFHSCIKPAFKLSGVIKGNPPHWVLRN